MEPSRSNSLLIIGGVILVAAIAAAVYVLTPEAQPVADTPQTESAPDVSTEVSGAVQSPAEQLPNTNPFSDYKNPFE